jgi:hypothetical protein
MDHRASTIISAWRIAVNCQRLSAPFVAAASLALRPPHPSNPLQSEHVEILLNCVWLALGLSLIATWSVFGRPPAVRRSAADAQSLPSSRVQFVAVLMLVILLFPVISLTDDLARCTAPQETERALRLHDSFDGSPSGPTSLPAATVWTELIAAAFRQVPHQVIEDAVELSSLLEATRLPVDSRPPPAAL